MPVRPARVVSWLIPALVVVIAVGGWGYYAWRFGVVGNMPGDQENPTLPAAAGVAPTGGAANGSSSGNLSPSAGSPDASARPQTADLGGPSAGVTVNTPGTYSEQPEMKLKSGARTSVSELQPNATVAGQAQPQQTPAAAAQSPAPTSPTAPSPSEIDAARAALARGDLPTARTALSTVLVRGPSATDETFARAELERMADAVLFSRATNVDDPLVGVHVVGGGESVNAIARMYKITDDLLVRLNKIADPQHLVAGQRLKIIRGPFSAVIDKSRHQMDVYLGDTYIRGFQVGLGANNSTPRGTWVVRNKLTNPEWIDPTTRHHYASDDADNPIGEHWIGMHCSQGECMGRTGFGLHGTIDPSSIGRDSSMGCVRLKPEDIAFVYDLFLEEVSRIIVK